MAPAIGARRWSLSVFRGKIKIIEQPLSINAIDNIMYNCKIYWSVLRTQTNWTYLYTLLKLLKHKNEFSKERYCFTQVNHVTGNNFCDFL